MSSYLGVEIGGSKLQIVAGDALGHIVDRRRFVVAPSQGATGIQKQIAEGIRELQAAHHPKGVGIGFGGPVDWRKGTIAKSHQIEGWSGFPIGDWVHDLTNLPTAVENDSNLATLAEAQLGAGAAASPVFYFNLGSGVGGGVAIDGKLFHGRVPGEGEFGHLQLDRSGVIVEQRCSGWAIDRRLRAKATAEPSGELSRWLGPKPGGEARQWSAALAAGQAGAQEVLRELASDLGYALSHVVHLLNPEVIVLGGGLSLVGEPLRQAIASALEPQIMSVFRPAPPIRLAKLGEDAVPVGALLLASGGGRK